MNRKEAFEVMKRGGYITHPILMDADAGPISLNGDTVCGKNNKPLGLKWEKEIDSQRFSSGWIECDGDGKPMNS